MRAAKVLALTVACLLATFALSLLAGGGQRARAEDAASVPTAPDPKPATPSKSATLPDFVPQANALGHPATSDAASEPSVEEPEGSTPPTDNAAAPAADVTTGAVSNSSAPAAKEGTSVPSAARTVDIKVEPIPGSQAATKVAWPAIIGAKNLFGEAKVPAPLEARAIGSYSRGCLSGAVPLPINGPAWQEMRLSRNRNWGHPELIKLIEQFAGDAQKLDGWPGLLVGDIAQPRGGPMITGHASHQIGLDADFWLTPMPNRRLSPKERETMEATSMLDSTGLKVDSKVFTPKQVALIKRAASYPEVERIFVHPAIKKALCEAAGTDRAWLGKVRPWYGHYYHFHMRIKCPPGFSGCTPQPAPGGDDGCGKEVTQWLAKVVPSKEPAPARPAGPPKMPSPPIMLADLPKECQSVLAAGPDPVRIPPAALMTRLEVRKALAKAAAVNVALEKASSAAGGKGSTAALAKSPALRPHLHNATKAASK